MGMKVKWIVIVCMVLLVGLGFVSFVSFDVASAQETVTTTVTYDYYVVAGYEMVPTPPSPAPSPYGFNFTADPPVYNFGSITKEVGKNYLYEGGVGTPTGSAHAKVDITNLLGYNIIITNLTAEITAGTPTKRFYFLPASLYFSNYTLVMVDTLDPWPPAWPPSMIVDEVNYTTGEVVKVVRDEDWWTKAVGIPEPLGEHKTGSASLLEPDYNSDAEATNHTAPIPLANGSTFTEYFGIVIFGDADVGTEITATITLSLTYEYEPPPGYPVPRFAHTPTAPFVNETVTFDASASYDPDGTIVSYVWDFGDETNGTGMIVTHTYTTLGTYTVILNVTDNEGRWLTASEFITVAVPSTVMSVKPWVVRVNVSDTFLVNITITNVTLQYFEFKLWYNSTLINATDVVLGHALANYSEVVKNLTVPGRVWYGGNLTTPPALNITAKETVAIISFTALEEGTTILHLNETLVRTMVDTEVVERLHLTEDDDVTVVPEFSAIILMPLFLIATLATAFLGKRVWSGKREDALTAE